MATPTPYAVLADLTNYGVGTTATFGSLSAGVQQKALDAANMVADSYLHSKFRLPLTAWGPDLTEAVVAIARFKLLGQRAFNPEGGSAALLVEAKNDAIRWFEGISKGTIT